MSTLYVAVTDLEGLASGARPPWPLAERLLARADRRVVNGDWRQWVLAQAGLTVVGGGVPLAQQVAQAAGCASHPAGGWWLVSPLHLSVGLSSVQVHPSGVLSLSQATQAGLVDEFKSSWPDPSVQLHATPFGLLLAVEPALCAHSVDPAGHGGRGLEEMRPTGPDGGALWRLMTELQMWLHERRLLSLQGSKVNALWLWGGGGGRLQGVAQWPVVHSADPWLRAVCGDAAHAVRTDRLETWSVEDAVAAGHDGIAMEQRWWHVLSQGLSTRQWQRALVYLDGVEYQLMRHHKLRLWRRSRVLGDRS